MSFDPSKPRYRIKLTKRRKLTGEHTFAVRRPTGPDLTGYIEWKVDGGFNYTGKTILACRSDNRLY
jgi:hypothetical protein